ncbi:MAG TPA: hypothetical protein VF290_02200 [Pyrinomonadaceae bacterium]
MAQTPGPQFWRKLTCEPLEPRTTLEQLENSTGLVIKGFTRITTIELRGIRVDAIEIRAFINPNYTRVAKGLVVVLREGGERPNENRAFVDYQEIEWLLKGIDVISSVDETATKLPGFEARYRTYGDLEISVFRQTRSGNAVTMRTGICDYATVTMSLDDLAKIKAMIQEAKTRLDDIK